MPQFFKKNKIQSVDDWFKYAPPMGGEQQWVDGRSAKELAKAWFPESGKSNIPEELQKVLNSHEETKGIVFKDFEPERETHFDKCGGSGRNADLVLWGCRQACDKVLVSIEAKTDEPFGGISGDYVDSAKKSNSRSRIPERFELLCQGVLGCTPSDKEARNLRYQLLTAVAGALVDAQAYGTQTVILIIHEFVSKGTDNNNLCQNANDLNSFVNLLSGRKIEAISSGEMVGPFKVPGNGNFNGTDSLFLGKCRRCI